MVQSECLAKETHPLSLGEYEQVCLTNDNRSVFSNVDEKSTSYIYYHENEEKWLISPKIGDMSASMAISSLQSCVDENLGVWNVFNGKVIFFID